ncbi:DUF1071 domain-containing protein [Lactococcus formosensis]|uniref:DUF1071 domain-containing protein n=1 Tax=Lactococcus formosensis TaxID=1281486 RepID=A0A9Q9D5V4_9LACT|nr:DUF1071 domain-containing protein [Lactococcus formosensis]USJ19568.1 DUF1071 domain-containing protein [Lactococcus formosensis]
MIEKKETVFETLNSLDVNGHTDTKKSGNVSLTYLSWAWAWAEVKKLYPEATYEIKQFQENRYSPMLPYQYDDLTGYMVWTSVTIEGITHDMWLPVMDGANKAMKSKPYKYMTKYNGEKTVEAASMFDVNKAIMRCLVKNLAMFGLGLYIYAGEDLPEEPPAKIYEVVDKTGKIRKYDEPTFKAIVEKFSKLASDSYGATEELQKRWGNMPIDEAYKCIGEYIDNTKQEMEEENNG